MAATPGRASQPGWNRKVSALVLLIVTVLSASSVYPQGEVNAQGEPGSEQEDSQFDFLKRQIDLGEAEDAIAELKTHVQHIEEEENRYHKNLVAPLTILGDAHAAQKDTQQALIAYARARHIVRIEEGLFGEDQLPLVYKESEAHQLAKDFKAAREREEYAVEVAKRSYGPDDERRLPALARLAEFYVNIGEYLAASELYQQSLTVHEALGTERGRAAIPALRGLAKAMRFEGYPPVFETPGDEPKISISASALRSPALNGTLSPNTPVVDYSAGEEALSQVVDILEQQPLDNPEIFLEYINARLELADWHVVFDRTRIANKAYVSIYEDMVEAGHDAAAFFSQPVLLHFPAPEDPLASGIAASEPIKRGVVSLRFNVAIDGRVRKMRTIESNPPRLMDYRVRRSLLEAVYRPRLVDGQVKVAKDITLDHRFSYHSNAVDSNKRDLPSPSTVGQVGAG